MFTLDLPVLFGIMAHSANRRVKIRDLVEFSDWLQVILDHVVANIYAGSNSDERDQLRTCLVERLTIPLCLTLTNSTNSHTLSRNQVNVFMSVMSLVFYSLVVRICFVLFFEMN